MPALMNIDSVICRDLFLGSLHSTEHQKIFGYVTNTKIKFIIIVESSNTALRYDPVPAEYGAKLFLTKS